MANIGDIVLVAPHHYVVMEFVGNARGTQDARLVRMQRGDIVRHQKDAAFLDVVASPVFSEGDRVYLNHQSGTVVATVANGSIIRVQFDDRPKPLADGRYKLAVANGPEDVPKWQLVLENSMTGLA